MTDPLDPRVRCVDCRHFRPWQCGNFRQARIGAPVVGPALANLLQRCPGFVARVQG
jgi:hypothetical protein